MSWILLILAILCFGLTFFASVPFRRDDSKMISPEDLRMMREQAAARKAAASDKNAENNRS
jgi:hypothetical protein